MKYVNKKLRKIRQKMIDNRVGEGDEYLPAERSKNPILSRLSGMKGNQKKFANKLGKGTTTVDDRIERVYDITNKIRSKIK